MKAVLEFNLDDESDRYQHGIAVNAGNLARLVDELNGWLRDQIKYHNRNEFEELRRQLYQMAKDYSLDLDDLSA